MRAIMMKEFQELRRDRRTLALLIAMPLLLLVIFGYAANFTVDTLSVALYGPGADDVASLIAKNSTLSEHLNVVTIDASGDQTVAQHELRDAAANVSIYCERAAAASGSSATLAATVYIDGGSLFAAQSARTLFAQAAQQLAAGASQQATAVSLTVDVLFNPDLKTSWVMIPAIIGLILTFIGTIITSIGLVREREAGTLEQLAIMPLRPSAVVLGKISPYFLLACLDMALITALGLAIFKIPFVGNPLIFVVGAALFLFVVLGLGVLISSVSQTTGQAIQLAFMVLLPQILLSGMIFPLSAMGAGVRWIGYCLPLTWFTMISQGVMVRGASWNALWLPLVVLAGMAVVIFGLAVTRLSRSISPVRAGAQHAAPPAEVLES